MTKSSHFYQGFLIALPFCYFIFSIDIYICWIKELIPIFRLRPDITWLVLHRLVHHKWPCRPKKCQKLEDMCYRGNYDRVAGEIPIFPGFAIACFALILPFIKEEAYMPLLRWSSKHAKRFWTFCRELWFFPNEDWSYRQVVDPASRFQISF